MLAVIFEGIWEDHNIVNKGMTEMFEVSEQLIHETLHIDWGILEVHQGDCRVFKITVIDNCETVIIVWMDEELEKEVRCIDDCEKALSLYRFDDVSL